MMPLRVLWARIELMTCYPDTITDAPANFVGGALMRPWWTFARPWWKNLRPTPAHA